jgi:ubiquinone/menaquinone biosynthesis C-methylase UbiE
MTTQTEWWYDFFPEFTPVFGNYSVKQTNAQVRYIISKLNLKPGDKLLDCPCGVGRLAIPLARKGIRVTGVDFADYYLDKLASKAKRGGLKVRLICSDMRKIEFQREFDAAINVWTSFGYFEKESDNKLVLKRYFRALKPGGSVVLNLINRDWIIRHYEKSSWFETRKKDVLVCEEHVLDLAKSRSVGTWHFIRDGVKHSRDISMRVYSLHELIAMLESVGFIDIESCGSVKHEPVTSDTSHMWVIGCKPKK